MAHFRFSPNLTRISPGQQRFCTKHMDGSPARNHRRQTEIKVYHKQNVSVLGQAEGRGDGCFTS